MSNIVERVGDYTVREQTKDEIHHGEKISFDLCGSNPYDHYQHVRRFVAEIQGEEVGEGWVMASRHQPWGYLGHFGMYAEEHKRKGLGGRLLGLCIDAMKDAGMEVMFIDTGPSIAHRVYEKYGFVDAIPDHPEWLGQVFGGNLSQYLSEYYDPETISDPEVRPLEFGHLIEIQALLNGWVGTEVLVKNYLLTLFQDDQVHLGQILIEIPDLCASRSVERCVQMLGLFSGSKLIGFCTIAPWRQTRWDNGHEAHIGLVDIYLHPHAWKSSCYQVLNEEIVRKSNEMNFSVLRMLEAPSKNPKTDALQDMGFQLKFELPDELVLGKGVAERGVYSEHSMESLAVYEMRIGQPVGFVHPYRRPWDY